MASNRKPHRNKKFAIPNPKLVPTESLNQFSVLERNFFPERYDENGVRKPATVKSYTKPKVSVENTEVTS